FGPACRFDAPAQLGKLCIGKRHVKRPDFGRLVRGVGPWVSHSVTCFVKKDSTRSGPNVSTPVQGWQWTIGLLTRRAEKRAKPAAIVNLLSPARVSSKLLGEESFLCLCSGARSTCWCSRRSRGRPCMRSRLRHGSRSGLK